jgi:hypothetical protein
MAFARLNSFWTNFYRIAKEEKILFDQAYTYNPEPKIEEEPELYHEIREKMFNHGIKTIVFSAFTLESFINDLASVKLGDSRFAKKWGQISILDICQYIFWPERHQSTF